jgi:hypothetical protein
MSFSMIASATGVVGIGFTLLRFAYLTARAQGQTKQAGSANAQMPMATAGAHKPVLDSENRPITAGGTVEDGPILFVDEAGKSGLTAWKHVMGTPQRDFILETLGSGVALLDYDNDGWLDIYLVNGASYASSLGKEPPPHAALFHNNHEGRFTKVTEKAAFFHFYSAFYFLAREISGRSKATRILSCIEPEFVMLGERVDPGVFKSIATTATAITRTVSARKRARIGSWRGPVIALLSILA